MTIEISTPEQLMAIKDWTDRGSTDELLDIILTNDLDFSNISDFQGVDTVLSGSTRLFANFDGQGYTIKNAVCYIPNNKCSFLGYFDGDITIKNLRISNCHITCNSASGGYFYWLFAGSSGSKKIENIVIENNNTVILNGCVANRYSFTAYSIYGQGTINIDKCGIGGNYDIVGSFIPFVASLVTNSYVISTITATLPVYGFMSGNGKAYNCFCRNTIKNAGSLYGFGNYNSGSYTFCYAANTFESEVLPNNFYGFSQYYQPNCYFDNTLISSATDDSLHGQPTENLKSVGWLRGQGWAI